MGNPAVPLACGPASFLNNTFTPRTVEVLCVVTSTVCLWPPSGLISLVVFCDTLKLDDHWASRVAHIRSKMLPVPFYAIERQKHLSTI
ncbi:hypothetical protein CEXT_671871 [Caerostris extrusa]|uniref:Uncharacterized protein n=1 Tax=Caerostris extrusa TaxID=172846 RepID=A0AAV4RYE1_CAEEX|nr:hypothetical protein CEXT_671871 [Caerostris extrusa]